MHMHKVALLFFCFILIFKEVSSKCGKFCSRDTTCSVNRSYFSHLYILTIYISDSYTNCFLMFKKKLDQINNFGICLSDR